MCSIYSTLMCICKGSTACLSRLFIDLLHDNGASSACAAVFEICREIILDTKIGNQARSYLIKLLFVN